MDDGTNTNALMAIFNNKYRDGRPVLLKNILTIHFEGVGGSSWIDIGEPEAGVLSYIWAKMPDNSQRWGLALYGMSIPGLQAVGIIVDSGSSYINVAFADLRKTTTHL